MRVLWERERERNGINLITLSGFKFEWLQWKTHFGSHSLSDQFDCDSLHLNVVTTDCTPIVSRVSADFSYVLSSDILISSHKSHNCSVYWGIEYVLLLWSAQQHRQMNGQYLTLRALLWVSFLCVNIRSFLWHRILFLYWMQFSSPILYCY